MVEQSPPSTLHSPLSTEALTAQTHTCTLTFTLEKKEIKKEERKKKGFSLRKCVLVFTVLRHLQLLALSPNVGIFLSVS